MALNSRLDLQASVRDWLALDTELPPDQIDRFIDLCEADLNSRLRVVSRQETKEIDIQTDVMEVPLGFRGALDITIQDPRLRIRLADESAVRVMQALRRRGTPKLFAIVGFSEGAIEDKAFLFAPTPDHHYHAILRYWKSFSIDSGAGGFELLARWPDAWLYGTLTIAGTYIADPRKADWEQHYYEAVARIIAEENETRFGEGANQQQQ